MDEQIDALLLKHGTTRLKQVWFTRDEVIKIAKEAAALSQPAAAEPATNSEIELARFHICGDYGNPLKLSALRTGRALDAVLQGRNKAAK